MVRVFHTEIVCPDGISFLVRFAGAAEVDLAIKKFLAAKKTQGTGENYTVIRLLDKRSIKIEKISPEKIISCSLFEKDMGFMSDDYVRRYKGEKG